MNERLEKIRQLLIELDDEIATGAASSGDRDFSALEEKDMKAKSKIFTVLRQSLPPAL
ncbi:hypothetical protein SBA3_2780015 [Candidatus Sulfopaludibacter sp. SbA3]|nr:hypothetical protein SBA3_2780015 [Candidatus Sulfopaludibacter sp. SbA3]